MPRTTLAVALLTTIGLTAAAAPAGLRTAGSEASGGSTNALPPAELRAAHQARESGLANASANGHAAASASMALVPIVMKRGRSSAKGPTAIVEPPRFYAKPADMRAFCESAHASACAYFPSNQTLLLTMVSGEAWGPPNTITDYDRLVSSSQCGKEGGNWEQGYSYRSGTNFWQCDFLYPRSVLVRFTPAENFKLSYSAHCNKSMWTYTVDPRGVVRIQLQHKQPQFTSGEYASCVVHVLIG